MRTIVMDSQVLSMFQECPHKFYLAMRENIKPLNAPVALGKGDLIHTGFEAYYRFLKAGLEADQDREVLHKHGMEVAVEQVKAKTALIDLALEESDQVIYQLTEYLNFYAGDDLVPLEVEEPFIKLLYENPEDDLRILYAGKIDLVATAYRYQWEPTPHDFKSSGRNTTPSDRSNQFFGYAHALDSNLIVVCKVGFQKTVAPSERFRRYPLSYPREYRENWVKNTIKWGYRLAWALDNNEYEENLTSCDKYSGCVYKPICQSITPEAREYKIQSEYIIGERWDVTKVLGLKHDEPEKTFAPQFEESSSVGSPSRDDANKGK